MERGLVTLEILARLAEATLLLCAPNVPEGRIGGAVIKLRQRMPKVCQTRHAPRSQLFEGRKADVDVGEARLEQRV